MTTAPSSQALQDIKVLDLSNLLAGPMSAMFLADFGADVVKIENPGPGDDLRRWGHSKDGVGLLFKMLNRNKRLITLKLSDPEAQEMVRSVIAQFDVVVSNFRPGTLEKWGIGYEQLKAIRPDLIMLYISGFGQYGPYSARPGFGSLAGAISGGQFAAGAGRGRTGGAPAFGTADAATALMGAFGVMVALHERERTGRGQMIDLALYEAPFVLLGPHVVDYDQIGLVAGAGGPPQVAPIEAFWTADQRLFFIAGSTQRTYEQICTALGARHLIDDERFSSNAQRILHTEALYAELAKVVSGWTGDDLTDALEAAGWPPVAEILSVEQIMTNDHMAARHNIAQVPDDELGAVRMQDVVPKLSATPGQIRWAGPRMSAHNESVYREFFGLDEQQINALRQKGII